MNTFPLFLAWRYMWGTRHTQAIGTMARVSCVALALASGALALTMCVMRGFEQSGHQLLQGINAPIIMSADQEPLAFEPIKDILTQEFSDVASFAPRDTQHGIIKDPVSGELSAPVVLLGIIPELEQATTELMRYLQCTHFNESVPLEALLEHTNVLIGDKLAHQFGLHVGDIVELMYSADNAAAGNKLYLSSAPLRISGIFKTGLEEVDAGTVYCSLTYLKKLFKDADVTAIAIKPHTNTNHPALIASLKDRFGMDVYSWQSLYPALVSALQLEKYAMFFILSLIILVASMTILALLYMQIQHKRGDIALLSALGVPAQRITAIFMCMGITIATLSCLVGLSLAALCAWAIEQYKLIPLPDSYMISHLPVAFEWQLFAYIFIFVVAVAVVATWVPCRALHTISIARLLKNQT